MCYHNDKWHLHKTPQVTFISIATISIAPTPLKKKKCSNYNMIQTRINWKLLPFTNITTHTKFIGTWSCTIWLKICMFFLISFNFVHLVNLLKEKLLFKATTFEDSSTSKSLLMSCNQMDCHFLICG